MPGAVRHHTAGPRRPVKEVETPPFAATSSSAQFPAPGWDETLEQYLDEHFPVLAAMSAGRGGPLISRAKANWKFCHQINLDGGLRPRPSGTGREE